MFVGNWTRGYNEKNIHKRDDKKRIFHNAYTYAAAEEGKVSFLEKYAQYPDAVIRWYYASLYIDPTNSVAKEN